MIEGIVIIFALGFGYYLGTKREPKQDLTRLEELVKAKGGEIHLLKEKPRPGVVHILSEQEIQDKHNPVKQGEKEAWNELMVDDLGYPTPKPEKNDSV